MDVIRTCIGCRGKAPKGELFRFVVDDSGSLAWDAAHLLPGRGAYLHGSTGCWELARKRRAFGRALRADVRVTTAPPPLTDGPA